MATVALAVDWSRFQAETMHLQQLIAQLGALPVFQRKMVAELIAVRLFLLIENSICSISCKLLVGAPYLDATLPARVPALSVRSMAQALSAMRTHARAKPRSLQWSIGKEIRANLDTTLQLTDPFFTNIMNHSAFFTELRYVRNHIVHGNDGTRRNFRNIVRQHFGGVKPGMTPGLLLLTGKLGPPSLIQQYLTSSRVFLKDLVRA